MSMRNYGVQAKCVCIKLEEMVDLLYQNKENINKDVFDFTDIKSANDIELSDIDGFSYYLNNSNVFFDFTGCFNINNKDIDLEEDNILIMELEKNALFQKYENIEEIYQEIQDNFKEVGINVDFEFIKEHFGDLEGTTYG